MFGFFSKKVEKSEFDEHKKAVQTALNSAKTDILNVSKWVEHLNNEKKDIKNEISNVYEDLSSVRAEVEELKNTLTLMIKPRLFKQKQTAVDKQTAVYAVENAVQTAVQTDFFGRFSISERALIMILLNTEMKLSYEDLGAMMGKDSATIRGQLNSIKKKWDGLIEEQLEKNNKKRLFIPEKIKAILLKKVKVRVRKSENSE